MARYGPYMPSVTSRDSGVRLYFPHEVWEKAGFSPDDAVIYHPTDDGLRIVSAESMLDRGATPVQYDCEDCGYEYEVDGPPITRTCPECHGETTPSRGAADA